VGALVDGAVGVTGNPVYQACVEAFQYTLDYTPTDTLTVSLGTGRFKNRRQPRWIGAWLEWVLAEQIDWDAILAGRETPFRIGPANTRWQQYRLSTF
jgi:hypothetical protein